MTEDEQKEILERYRKALESIRLCDPGLPDVPVFRGTMLVQADGTEYHYDDEWCRAEDMKEMGARLKRYLDVAQSIEIFNGDEIGGDLSLYVSLEDVAALLADAALVRSHRREAEAMAPPSTAPCPQDPVLESLRNAPVDDEPETAEERAAVKEERARFDAGEPTIALEDYAAKWGIRL